MYRKWKSTMADLKAKDPTTAARAPLTKLTCSRGESQDMLIWKEELQDHCRNKAADVRQTVDIQLQRLRQLRLLQRNVELDGIRPRSMSVGILLQAKARMARGKAAGGGDQIVVGILLRLLIVVVYFIAGFFGRRYPGASHQKIKNWRTILMMFLAKHARALLLNEFRNISLISVLGKW